MRPEAGPQLPAAVTLRNQVAPWLMLPHVLPDGRAFPDLLPGQPELRVLAGLHTQW